MSHNPMTPSAAIDYAAMLNMFAEMLRLAQQTGAPVITAQQTPVSSIEPVITTITPPVASPNTATNKPVKKAKKTFHNSQAYRDKLSKSLRQYHQSKRDSVIVSAIQSRIASLEEAKSKIDIKISHLKSKIASQHTATDKKIKQRTAAKRVRAINLATGEVVKFESQLAAAKAIGAPYSAPISIACRSVYGSDVAYGFRWEFDK